MNITEEYKAIPLFKNLVSGDIIKVLGISSGIWDCSNHDAIGKVYKVSKIIPCYFNCVYCHHKGKKVILENFSGYKIESCGMTLGTKEGVPYEYS